MATPVCPDCHRPRAQSLKEWFCSSEPLSTIAESCAKGLPGIIGYSDSIAWDCDKATIVHLRNGHPLKIKSITVVRGSGTDKVTIAFDGPTPFPELAQASPASDYGPYFSVSTRHGYAEEWLKKMGYPPPLVIPGGE